MLCNHLAGSIVCTHVACTTFLAIPDAQNFSSNAQPSCNSRVYGLPSDWLTKHNLYIVPFIVTVVAVVKLFMPW